MGLKEYLVIGLCILIGLIIFQISKASELLGLLKTETERRYRTNKIQGWLLIAFLIVGLFGAWWANHTLYHKTLFPQGAASDHGEKIDLMLWITITITGIVLIGTQILLFWFGFRYKSEPGRKAVHFAHSTKLEIIWTSIPAIVLLILVVFGLKYWLEMTSDAPKDSVVIEITGHQFGWDYRYPGPDGKLGKKDYRLYNKPLGNTLAVDFNDPDSHDDIRTTEMHIPVGKPVKLVIHAQDVIHNVGLPHFRMKMDAVPGIPTTIWFTPLYTTEQMKERTKNPNFTYEIACDQMCGKGHFSMRGTIVVEEEEQYKKWLSTQKSEYSMINKSAPAAAADTVKVATAVVKDTVKIN